MSAQYIFHGDLRKLLRLRWRQQVPVIQEVNRSASIKDVIESLGLPHTEVGIIECDGVAVDFSHLVKDGQKFDIHPVAAPCDVTRPTYLRPEPLDRVRFLVDANVGRLARYLRMAGFDTLYDNRATDGEIVRLLARDRRIVLTRDLGLLKRKTVEHGRYVRSDKPSEQLREIMHFYGLALQADPFSRCLECNSLLKPVRKADIRSRLEPLTDRYYRSFSVCPLCDKLYWAGSHVAEMRRLFPELGAADTRAEREEK